MVGQTAPIRPEERERFRIIKTHCGCLLCLLCGMLDVHATIQHCTEGFNRVGDGSDEHKFTYGSCIWHHFGEALPGWQQMPGALGGPRQAMVGNMGPSLAWGRRVFEEHFGDEVTVLVPVQDFMLARFESEPWPEYHVPRRVAREVRNHWIDLHAGPSQFTVPS